MDKEIKITISDDKELVSEIRAGLKETGGYCPCRIQRTPDTRCMCKEFRDQIEAGIPGTCHCGLYVLTVE